MDDTIREAYYAPNTAMAPHLHEESSITIVLNGSYTENIRGRKEEHRTGSLLFYPAGESHSQLFGSKGSRKLIFRPPPEALVFLLDGGVRLDQAPTIKANAVSWLGARMLNEMRSPDAFSHLALDGMVSELIAVFGRGSKTPYNDYAVPLWLRQVRERLECQSTHTLSQEQLAFDVGKHPVHLAKAFRKYFGETIGEYRRRLQLRKAELLLHKGHISLTELALECGFASHSHFSRSFRLAYGVTPSAYRRSRPGAGP